MFFFIEFDVIVVGGGYVGMEVVLVLVCMGVKIFLLIYNIEMFGQMSCNLLIGGIGKGYLVKEVDVLGGVMVVVMDESGIQFWIFNLLKGLVVCVMCVQVDCILYKVVICYWFENQLNLWLFQQVVDDLIVEGDCVVGVVMQIGICFCVCVVVLMVGMFFDGKIYVGLNNYMGGCVGDLVVVLLLLCLKELKLLQGCLKIGMLLCIDGCMIDFLKFDEQLGDFDLILVFLFLGCVEQYLQQLLCWVMYMNECMYDIICGGFDCLFMYIGVIEGVGLCYCLLIEDKIYWFVLKELYQIFLELEGLMINEFYLNGILMSLLFDVQFEFVYLMCGFENVYILCFGYVIEYDYFDLCVLKVLFEMKVINGLFFVGQINGMIGYEEVVVQGLLVGFNVGCYVQEKEVWCLWCDQVYLGVLVDDFVMCGVVELYWMFMSCVEYCLSLCEDNVDMCLIEIGCELGLVDDVCWDVFSWKCDVVLCEIECLKLIWVMLKMLLVEEVIVLFGKVIDYEYSFVELLCCLGVSYDGVCGLKGGECGFVELLMDDLVLFEQIKEQVEIGIKYQGYIECQVFEIECNDVNENMCLLDGIDYCEVCGLLFEVSQKFNEFWLEMIG